MAEIVARMPAVAILSKTFLDAPDEETGDLAPSAEDRFAGAALRARRRIQPCGRKADLSLRSAGP